MISAFSLLAVLLTVVWLVVFLRNKELRQEMSILSICAFFLAPVIITVKGGNPDVIAMRFSGMHFVDLLFAFSVAGLAGTFYHALFGKHYHRLPKLQHKKSGRRHTCTNLAHSPVRCHTFVSLGRRVLRVCI